MKKKKILSLLLAVCLVSALGLVLTPRASAATYTTKAECASNVLTVSANAPSSVTANTAFSITNVSSTSTAPNGITVSKIVSTSSVTYGSPASMVGTWTGTGTGTFTAHFPDAPLTAGGNIGSQLTIKLSSIDLYVFGPNSTPITCSLANGQLTANKPGESLTILSIPIVAPVTAPSTTNTPKTTTSSNPTSKTTPTTQAPATTTTPTTTQTPAAATTPATDTQTSPKSQLVTITVVDTSGNPMSDVPVTIDSSPAVKTNTRGVAIFENLTAGKHKVSVLGKNTKINRDINVSEGTEPVELTVELPHQIISPLLAIILGGVVLMAILVGIIGFILHHHRKAKSLAHHIAPSVSTMTPIAPVVPATPTSPPATSEQTPVQPTSQPLPADPLPVEPSPSGQAAQPVAPTQPVAPVQPSPVQTTPPVTPAPNIQPLTLAPEPVPSISEPAAPVQPIVRITPDAPHQPGQMIVPQASHTSIETHM